MCQASHSRLPKAWEEGRHQIPSSRELLTTPEQLPPALGPSPSCPFGIPGEPLLCQHAAGTALAGREGGNGLGVQGMPWHTAHSSSSSAENSFLCWSPVPPVTYTERSF